MAKYGFSTTVPYGTDLFEVTGTEYCEWEDALEKTDGDSNAMEWATYDFLINNGYLVSAPTSERPKPKGKQGVQSKTTGAKGKASQSDIDEAERARTRGVASPGIRGVPDGFDLISGESREPTWTQSRILTERDKLLKERERIFELKEKALNQKIIEQQLIDKYKPKQPDDMGNQVFYTSVGIVTVVILFYLGWLIN